MRPPPPQRSGASPPRERPASKNSSRCLAAEQDYRNPLGPHDTAVPAPGDSGPAVVSPGRLRRRRAASWRCEPLESGYRDPWVDQRDGPISTRELDSWRAAAQHLRAHGLYGSWQDSAQIPHTRRGDAS
jgi:hypothetical protein